MTRARALRRVAALYLLAQPFARVSLRAACSEPVRAGLWRYAALAVWVLFGLGFSGHHLSRLSRPRAPPARAAWRAACRPPP
jgi:hypothetical protein